MQHSKKKNPKESQSGFTLIEIILVVVIIGILAGITIPRIGGRTEMAKITQAKTTINTYAMAIGNYEMEKGHYPSSLEELTQLSDDGRPYIEKLPKAPWDGVSFVYTAPGANNKYSFDISCTSPNGKSVNNWDD